MGAFDLYDKTRSMQDRLNLIGSDPVVIAGVYKAGQTRRGTRAGGVPSEAITRSIARRHLVLLAGEQFTTKTNAMSGKNVRLATRDDLNNVEPKVLHSLLSFSILA